MEVFKTLVHLEGDLTVSPFVVATIFHQGIWWLVPSWAQPHAGGQRCATPPTACLSDHIYPV